VQRLHKEQMTNGSEIAPHWANRVPVSTRWCSSV